MKFLGDGSMLAFESARAAVRAAIEIQKATVDAPFSVRIGIHTGEVQRTADDLFGVTVNRAAWVAAASDAKSHDLIDHKGPRWIVGRRRDR